MNTRIQDHSECSFHISALTNGCIFVLLDLADVEGKKIAVGHVPIAQLVLIWQDAYKRALLQDRNLLLICPSYGKILRSGACAADRVHVPNGFP
eukprot:5420146-Pleurochrysis_carterae.AAC.1